MSSVKATCEHQQPASDAPHSNASPHASHREASRDSSARVPTCSQLLISGNLFCLCLAVCATQSQARDAPVVRFQNFHVQTAKR